jgi:probable HAF family extracellular repeat protein
MADLGTFGFTGSDAYAINDVGQIVGSVRQVSGDRQAFLFDRGELVLLNSLLPPDSGWSLTEAFGIAMGQEIHYDEQGNVTTASFMDYAIPRADGLPDIEVLSTNNSGHRCLWF